LEALIDAVGRFGRRIVRHVRARAGRHLVERLDVLSVSIVGDGSAIQKISRAARRTLLRIHPAADASVIVGVVPTKRVAN
jgi:hypothetical protein